MTHRRCYVRPAVLTLTARDLVEAMGPAHANHCYHDDDAVAGSRMAGRGRR